MNRITTPVDNMVEILKKRGKLAVRELSRILGVDQLIVERWLAVLELNNIVRFDYKGLNEFIEYIEKEGSSKNDTSETSDASSQVDIEELKRHFLARIQKEDLTSEEAQQLWRRYVESISDTLRSAFYQKAREKGIPDPQIESYWQSYKQEVVNL